MKRIVYILLLAMGMATVAPMVSIVDNRVAAVFAADDKAKAKAQREKEKAKAAKEKERAKAKAAKEKEKAKAAKQKEIAREKSNAAAAKQAAAAKPAVKEDPNMSAAEEKAQYMEAVAAIDKANAKAIAYNERDIAHRLGFWGQIGYSNLFTSGIQFNDQQLLPMPFTHGATISFSALDDGLKMCMNGAVKECVPYISSLDSKNYSNPDIISRARRSMRNISSRPIGNYQTYRPFDLDYEQNRLLLYK